MKMIVVHSVAKMEGTNFQFSEANSSTFDKENWLEERNSSIVAIKKLESVLCVSIEEDKIQNMYLCKIFHAIVLVLYHSFNFNFQSDLKYML